MEADRTMLTLSQTSSCNISDETVGKEFCVEWSERKDGIGDLEITVGNAETSSHRTVLMASSDYFKAMFSAGFSETGAKSIDLSDTFEDIHELNCVLDYIYTGHIKLSTENIIIVLNAACHFLMSNLKYACSVFLIANVSPKTCIPIFVIADRYSLTKVQAFCLEVIKSWFPFNLWNSKEALEIPPDCIISLIRENVFELVSEDLKNRFLQHWCDHLTSTSNSQVVIPQEITDLLHPKISLDPSKIYPETNRFESVSKPAEVNAQGVVPLIDQEKQENVLFAVFTIPTPEAEQCCVEVHAFIPRLKTWKFALRHTFNDSVKSNAVPTLIGVNKMTAFFLLRRVQAKTEIECVIAIDLQANTENIISVCEHYGYNPYYFLWEESLCMIDSEDGLYRSDHLVKCTDKCDRSCWNMIGDLEFTHHLDFVVKTHKNVLYIWSKGCVMGYFSPHYGYIRNYMTQLVMETDTGQCVMDEFCDYLPTDGSEEFNDTELDRTLLCDIALDPIDGRPAFTVTHIIQGCDRKGAIVDEWYDEHKYEQLSLSTSDDPDDGFVESVECTLSYPDVPTYNKSIMRYKTCRPVMYSCKRLVLAAECDFDIWDDEVWASGPETCIGAMHYAKTTSPYNTSVWRLKPVEKKWQLVARLPHSLNRFTYFKSSDVCSSLLHSLPDSYFEDFSVEIGQSALWPSEMLDTKVKVNFTEELLSSENYEQKWCELWERCFT